MSTRTRKRRTARLRDRVTFEQKDGTESPGITAPSWEVVIRNVEAEVMATGGGANTSDDQLQEQLISTVVIRYPKTGDGWFPTAQMRVIHDSRTLNVRRVADVDGDRRYLHIQCVEVA